MAGSLLALLDDIATILDDVAVMSKVAAKKTAGVLGDDLALNAQQVSGVSAERELPVVWAVALGSLKNKAILVPAALAISSFAPWAVTPLLMIGGAFLCYEGFEKLAHKFLHSKSEDDKHHQELIEANRHTEQDIVALEKEKIKGAIRTDFILSAEIIVISLGTVAGEDFMKQVGVLVAISLIMTVGVYGFVAAIVKMDDLGLHMSERENGAARGIGRMLVLTAPKLMKLLTVVGTAAMFMVGGSILLHGFPVGHHLTEWIDAHTGPVMGFLGTTLADAVIGIIAGGIVVGVVTLGKRMFGRKDAATSH
ncbi:MAG TPA: DUF808 domain-containing protein [Telluria sp.]|nr:DUF808 domain-containing protein [Telluria sp.]